MKKISLLTLALLTSCAYINAEDKKEHACTKIANGLDDKMLVELATLPVTTKMQYPDNIIAMLSVLLCGITKDEVRDAVEIYNSLTPAQQKQVYIASQINNGWNTLAGLGVISAIMYVYNGGLPITDDAKITAVRVLLGSVVGSRLLAAMIAKFASHNNPNHRINRQFNTKADVRLGAPAY